MPHYEFLCLTCQKKFDKVMHISDLDKGEVACPHCGSKQVEQQVSSFSAVTSRKS